MCREERMDTRRYPGIALYGRVDGIRSRGRPKRKWMDVIEKDCDQRGKTLVEATRLARSRRE